MAFSFADMKKINRRKLGNMVPLELFRTIRLIGMKEGLPMEGKTTTLTIGREIGESFPAETLESVLALYKDLKIGIPTIIEKTSSLMRIKIEECFCKGLPVHEGKHVCDLEGAILEGALAKVMRKDISVYEVKCNINGDENCEYLVRISENLNERVEM